MNANIYTGSTSLLQSNFEFSEAKALLKSSRHSFKFELDESALIYIIFFFILNYIFFFFKNTFREGWKGI